MDFKGKGVLIDDLDLPRIGAQIGVGEDEIHVVLEVEASGSGFDSHGRLKMLFEPHIFYRNLPARLQSGAEHEGLAYRSWRPGAYPADSYPRLQMALTIDETAALKSASWGLGQILGENFWAAGYASVQEMIVSFCADEANQLQAMVNFIRYNKLDGALRRHDWAGFARGYNGPNYARNGYDHKLAAAFARWQRIKDTPYPPTSVPPAQHPVQVAPVPKMPQDVKPTKWKDFWAHPNIVK